MQYYKIQSIEDEINLLSQNLAEDETIVIDIKTFQTSFSTSYRDFTHIPDENIIQIYSGKYYVIRYEDIQAIDFEVVPD